MFNKKLIAMILMVCLSLGFVGCQSKDNGVESKIDQIKKSGKLVIGTSADYPPYEFHKEVNGKHEIVGFDIEIAKEIAKDLGVELEIKDMRFDGLLAALQSGNVDIVIAGMTPTEERKQNVDFSNIYYTSVQSVIVRYEDKDSIKTLKDLDGKIVGAQKGSIQEQIVTEQIEGANLRALGKISDLVLSLKNNKVDAIVLEKPVANSYVNKNLDLYLTEIKFEEEDAGSAVAIKKGNDDLVEAINKTLERLINDNSIERFVMEAIQLAE
ncbi:amino acid ABC transporter substrate-binding protein, PAAT family (TC 3.A.1.3.-) [Alkalithermobacter thermoalcaliphilus JW-YL-7 = DSM 7308]|uniref:ABC-type transporter, periplasmic subunit family 3 n=1 Tax=Alkalithermobacter thermoalcaliphilus JW-YL-7 = DSM 7308 TaxID=1121328 RepID=A0A150FQ24_CLOPD|nr:ABC-type transporter, periplasmic subunit family 3 [[Clostridium] paradoxum JW-YL-7 = DSM 7308]SHK63952.1 amino acid ABC transporter substrate-binding protein, PAAT family (TC 3.A.1.3.-) [[Clostridium] paradoxum JW-YL-7 = DSM 7308]